VIPLFRIKIVSVQTVKLKWFKNYRVPAEPPGGEKNIQRFQRWPTEASHVIFSLQICSYNLRIWMPVGPLLILHCSCRFPNFLTSNSKDAQEIILVLEKFKALKLPNLLNS
jgi:hypothetical protein